MAGLFPVECQRCGAHCQAGAPGNPKARMLRRSTKGLCINCAVHDWLRNTYPCNILLAQSGPKALVHPHIQEQFAGIMRVGMADAMPDEIDWNLIIENWDLPFPHKIKASSTNPCSQVELDEIASGKRRGLDGGSFLDGPAPQEELTHQEIIGRLEITSFEQLNDLEPGLGDDLRDCLGAE